MNKDFTRHAHNYLFQKKNNDYHPQDIELLNDYLKYSKQDLKKYKVALLLVSVNSNYWQYAGQVVEDLQKNFLPGHKTDMFLWSDMPKWTEKDIEKKLRALDESEGDQQTVFFSLIGKYIESLYLGAPVDEQMIILGMRRLGLDTEFIPSNGQEKNLIVKNINAETPNIIRNGARELLEKYKNLQESCTVTEVEPIEWPYGTLMRYSMFLQQEEALKDYDYVFYMDVDMRIVNIVGDEILGEGLTMAEHPMYALRRDYVPPYEPNSESAAYIPRLGQIIAEDGKPRLKPLYAAGGFQGGKTKDFIHAMKAMKGTIDKDFNKNYIAIWNDESHWNRYLYDYKGALTVLSPSYIYPDSLIQEYYVKLWGRNYPPKIITLTKPFTLQKLDASRFNSM